MSEFNLALRLAPGKPPIERMHLLAEWLQWWFGPATRPSSSRVSPSPELPETLRALYALYPDAPEACQQNVLASPPDLAVESGQLLFAYENQGVYLWGTAPSGLDPPVFGRWERSDPWKPDVPQLSLFLIQFFLFEAAIAARLNASAADLGERDLRALHRSVTPLDMPPWHWPAYPTTFHVHGGAILVTSPNDDGWSVFVGGKTPTDMEFLKNHVNDHWECAALGSWAG